MHYRGQLIGGVIAESAETARHAAGLVRVDYDEAEHDTELRVDHPGLYAPDRSTRPSRPTPPTATSRPRCATPPVTRRPDVHHAAGAQQPDGTPRHHRDLGSRTARG